MPQHPMLDEIRQLDPVTDHQRIVYLDTAYEFPFDLTRSLEFALFRTYAVPSIGGLLKKTGEFTERAQKRYDDTDLLISAMAENGYDSEIGRAALRRMNQQHGRYPIANADFLYVLSTFVFEPIRWNARFGWRRMIDQERLAHFYFWREVGRRMNIQAIPDTYAELERYNIDYERSNFRYTEEAREVANATRDLFLSWFIPRPLWPIGYPVVYAMMDDPLREAFHFPKPPAVVKALVTSSLKLRGLAVRILPPRHHPRQRTAMRHRSYPNGYQIEELGPAVPASARAQKSDTAQVEEVSQ